MPSPNFRKTSGAMLLAAVAAAYPLTGWSAPAARVDFTTGNVTAIGPGGKSRTLSKGANVEQGETIATNNGRAQLRFTDGAYVSLQPESEFRIDQYRFDGKQDGNEKGLFSLIKGGLRTITGLVGRNNKNNYQITTSVATIGIRGTEYTIQYGQSITGTVGEGQIEVCNGGGCLDVTNGESYYVQGQDFKPILTNKRTDLPPPPPQNPPPQFKESENVTETGDLCVLFPSQCGPTPLLTGSGNFHVGWVSQFGSNGVSVSQPAVLDNGQLTSFTRFSSSEAVSGPFSEVGGDDIIVWGRAASFAGGESLHYVAGVPASNMAALGGMVATYTLMGATSITDSNNSVIGKLNGMSMSANFQSGGSFASLDMSMNMTLGSQVRTPTGSGFLCGGSFFFCASQTIGCSTVTSVGGSGFFAGANAVRAGFVYSVYDNDLEISGHGAGALKQTGTSIAAQ
jgi:hypothetical protein